MNPESWQQVKEIFGKALEAPPEERESLVHAQCAGNPELEREVLELLEHHGRVGGPFTGDARAALPSAGMPDSIGPYRILGVLGRGGMGLVFRARQEHPRREVALKVMQQFSFGRDAERRFRQEAQVLARLSHPGIAAIFEAGTFEDGGVSRPFFAMELIDGIPLDRYAQDHSLDVPARLSLVQAICDAVAHAHERGVVHRDLKPANVLVDARGAPKVLDFGVARVRDEDSPGVTTASGDVFGTLHYMSPEQIQGRGVDARSDIYSLGVVLYELLSGRLPNDIAGRAPHEVARVIVEEEMRPLAGLNHRWRAELETILRRALEKDPARRYPSVAAFGEDLRRLSQDQPITARPASTLYQIRKYARRNRALVAGLAATFLALLLGLAGTASQALRATEQRDRAQAGEQDARREADAAGEVADLLTRLLTSPDPGIDGAEVKAVDLLARGVADLDTQFKGPAAVEAQLRLAIGRAYQGLGQSAVAREQLEKALPILERELGAAHEHTLQARATLGATLVSLGEYARAEPLLKQSLDAYRAPESRDSREEANVLTSYSCALFGQGRFDEAPPVLEEAIAGLRAQPGEPDAIVLTLQGNLAAIDFKHGEHERGVERLRAVLAQADARSDRGGLHRALLLQNLAFFLDTTGKLDEAYELLTEVVETDRATYPKGHPQAATRLGNLGLVELRMGRMEEARLHCEAAVAMHRRLLPADHPDLRSSLNALGGLHMSLGEWPAAAKATRESLKIARARFRPEDREFVESLANCAKSVQMNGGEAAGREALELFRELLELRTRTTPEDRRIATAHVEIGRCLIGLGQADEGYDELVKGFEILVVHPDNGAARAQVLLEELAEAAERLGRDADVERWRALDR